MIPHPEIELKLDHGISGDEINIITFGEETALVRNIVVSTLHCFISKTYEKYQENENEELFEYCYDCCIDCSIPCIEAFEIMRDENATAQHLIVFIDFLNYLLNIVYIKHDKSKLYYIFDDYEEIKFQGIIKCLAKYVMNPDNPKTYLGFSNLSKLIQMVKMINFLNEDFFSRIFYCFVKIEKYRLENQYSLIDLLCSVASSYNDKVIRIMLNTFQQFHTNSKESEDFGEPIMLLFSQSPNTKARQKFCQLCFTLIESCFEEFKINKIHILYPNIEKIFLNQQILFRVQQSDFSIKENGSIDQPKCFAIQKNGLVVQQTLFDIQKNGFILVNNGYQQESEKEINFEEQQQKFDEQQRRLYELRSNLNTIGSNWIDFIYNNNILYILCDMALNEEIYIIKTSAAQALSGISRFLPGSILGDLIMNHNFIEIFHQLVGGEKYVFECVIWALTSVLNFISSLPTNSDGCDMYLKLADTNLLNEIEDCGKSHEDRELMKRVDSLLDTAVIERDRFTAFLLNRND